MSDADREAKGVATNLLTLVAQASLPAFHIQLMRFLHAEGWGAYKWSNDLVDTFSLLTLFGMDQAVARHVALAYADGDDERAVAATGTALRVVVLSGLFISAAIALVAPAIAAARGQPAFVAPLRVLAIVPVFYHATTVFIVATQARRVMKYNFWVRGVVQPLGLLLLTSAVLRWRATAPAAAAAVVLGMALTTVAAAWAYHRELPLGATLRAAVRGPADRALLTFALPLVLANLVWSLQGNIDGLFLGAYQGAATFAPYAASLLYVKTISQVRQAFDPVVCALIPPALARGDVAGLTVQLQRQTRWSALAAVPLFVLFAGFGGPLLAVFGHGFPRGSTAMVVLSAGHLFNAVSLSAWAVSMSGHAKYTTAVAGIAVASQVVMLPLLVPRYGLLGAALSASVGFVLAQGLQVFIAYRLTGVHGYSWGLAKVFAAGGLAWVAGRATTALAWSSLSASFFAGVASALLAFLVAVPLLGLEADEAAALRTLRARLFRRPPSDA